MAHVPAQTVLGRVSWLGGNNRPQRDSPHILQTAKGNPLESDWAPGAQPGPALRLQEEENHREGCMLLSLIFQGIGGGTLQACKDFVA